MTKKQKLDKINFIKIILQSQGWVEDRWGNFKITVDNEVKRIKFQKTSLRYEVKIGSRWAKLTSDYFKNIKTYEKDSIKGFQINYVMILNR